MSKERREKQAKLDKKLAANELMAGPQGKDLKNYRKATMAEELELTKSAGILTVMVEKTGRLKNEIQVHKANTIAAEGEYRNALLEFAQRNQAHKKIMQKLGMDPEDPESVKDHDGVMYLKLGASTEDKKIGSDTPPAPVSLEPGKTKEVAPGIEVTLNDKTQ